MERKSGKRIHGLAALAGICLGAFLGAASFLGSSTALGVGAFLGLLLSPALLQMTLASAGVLTGMGGIGSGWTEQDDRRDRRIASVLLVLVILSSLFGILFLPAAR